MEVIYLLAPREEVIMGRNGGEIMLKFFKMFVNFVSVLFLFFSVRFCTPFLQRFFTDDSDSTY